MSDDYEVGYGKPPEHGKIKPGERRNPNGRPSKVTGAFDPNSILGAEHKVRLNGKDKSMSSAEIRLRRQVHLALDKKKVGPAIYLIREFEKYGLIAAEKQEQQCSVILMPSDMPGGMVRLLRDQYGFPPWTEEERAWARRVYLRIRTEKEREEDEYLRWPCLEP